MLNGQRHVVIAIYDVTAGTGPNRYTGPCSTKWTTASLVEKTGNTPDDDIFIRAANPALQKLAGHDVATLIGTMLYCVL